MKITLPIFLLLFLSSCKLFDREEKLPFYLGYTNPTVAIDTATSLTGIYGAKDMWVYRDGELLGIYPFNTWFPVNQLEPGTYLAQPGIFESGISSFRINYPFWKPIVVDLNPLEGDTVSIPSPIVYYNDSFIVNSFLENFENSFTQFYTLNNVDSTNMYRSPSGAFEGNFCGRADFDSTHKILDIISDYLPEVKKNTDIYAEITFKSDFPLRAGLFYFNPQPVRISEVELVPKQEWTTVFIHLVKMIRDAPAIPGLQFSLWIYSDAKGASGKVEIDYVRVVHFKEE